MSQENDTPQKISGCRACGNGNLVPCVSIGSQYLSSVFPATLDYANSVPRWPLDLVMCKKSDATCGLVQLAHAIDLTSMYDAYPYTSSTNSSMAGILQSVAEDGKALKTLESGDVVLDIGGNDGTLLSFFKDAPVSLVNIDPAKNVKPLLQSERYTHLADFFSEAAFKKASGTKAKLIFSVAMFYHLSDPLRFTREVAACLHNAGAWIIQMAYLPAMLWTNMYDNIVHEHNGYYAAQHTKWIMEQAGLEVFDVSENAVYGGSFRVFVKKKGNAQFPLTARYQKMLADELRQGIFDEETYRQFAARIQKTREDLRALCASLRDAGKAIWIYGASTKGNTILQYCGLGKEYFTAAADSNPFKVGKYIIGSDVPITSEAEMRAAKPDYLLALPYSFVDAFMKREADLVVQGTKFIVPLPAVKVI
ncbi:MAG: class I SAM-dependent methyltransferase [Candidatus Liptonbacteria bacterium]|nr:class I SAM-dependent methyltransferase [Candidatus Liptonbacteria bacterium]MBI3114742.1 class I SAM-dependent methyltransferase [Candidatus Harrisonbacteria bacterium]